MNKQQVLDKAYKQGFEGERNVRGCAQCAIAAVLLFQGLGIPM